MPILPSRIQDLLDFADMHGNLWTTVAAQIGLTPAQATAFKGAASKARGNYIALLAAEEARAAASITSRDSISELRRIGGDTLRLIKAFAENQSDPNTVYTIAQIPPPAAPSPAPPPALPTDIRVGIDIVSGAVTLAWKASNPANTAGTSYIIRRRLPGETAFGFVGVTGTKNFIDTTLPAGPDSVSYSIQGTRSGTSGPAAEVNVRFGSAGGGGGGGVGGLTIAEQTTGEGDGTGMKMAA